MQKSKQVRETLASKLLQGVQQAKARELAKLTDPHYVDADQEAQSILPPLSSKR